MKKLAVIIIWMLLSISCTSQHVETTIFSFNSKASSAFSTHKPLNSVHISSITKCVIEKDILNLDALNRREVTVVDSLIVRSYLSGAIGNFNFIANLKSEFYFIYIPEFDEYKFHSKLYLNSSQVKLKDSTGNFIRKIEPTLLNQFLQTGFQDTKKSAHAQVATMDNLFRFLLKDVFQEPSYYGSLLSSLETRPKKQREEITAFLNKELHVKGVFENFEQDLRVFNSSFGFIVLKYLVSDASKNQITVNLYVVPHEVRRGVFMKSPEPYHKDCFR